MSLTKLIGLFAGAQILAMQCSCIAQQQTWGNGPKWSATAGAEKVMSHGPMGETKLLYKNDALVPTQNRTQAMRLEAETGHINPQVDSKLEPYIKKTDVTPPHAVKRAAAKRRPAKLILSTSAHR